MIPGYASRGPNAANNMLAVQQFAAQQKMAQERMKQEQRQAAMQQLSQLGQNMYGVGQDIFNRRTDQSRYRDKLDADMRREEFDKQNESTRQKERAEDIERQKAQQEIENAMRSKQAELSEGELNRQKMLDNLDRQVKFRKTMAEIIDVFKGNDPASLERKRFDLQDKRYQEGMEQQKLEMERQTLEFEKNYRMDQAKQFRFLAEQAAASGDQATAQRYLKMSEMAAAGQDPFVAMPTGGGPKSVPREHPDVVMARQALQEAEAAVNRGMPLTQDQQASLEQSQRIVDIANKPMMDAVSRMYRSDEMARTLGAFDNVYGKLFRKLKR